jgi:hypothetical protein
MQPGIAVLVRPRVHPAKNMLVSLAHALRETREATGWKMTAAVAGGHCQRAECANPIPKSLAGEQLCLDHFLDEAFIRSDHAMESCRAGQMVKASSLEWLLSDALATVKNLEEGAADPNPEQRDRMLELLLILANLHEYVAHHSVLLERRPA